MKTYSGTHSGIGGGQLVQLEDGKRITTLKPRTDLWNHSPDGLGREARGADGALRRRSLNPTFRVSTGILDPKHVRQIGPAFWIFLWCISRQTDARGNILGGSIVQAARISSDLFSSRRSVLRNLRRLERYKYLEIERCVLGLRLRISAQKKFREHTKTLLDKAIAMGVNLVGAGAPRKCVYCDGREGEPRVFLQEDHFFPRSKGGTRDPQNMVWSCLTCNALKGNRVFKDIESCRLWLLSMYRSFSTGSTGRAQEGGAILSRSVTDLSGRAPGMDTPCDLGSSSDLDLRSTPEKRREKRQGTVGASLPVEIRSRPMIGFASAAHAPRSCSRCGGAGASGSPCLCAGCAQLLRELDLEIGRGVPGGPSVTSLDGATRQAVLTAYHGKRVQCSLAQYPVIRPRLIQAVQFLVAERDEAAAERVMLEVLRLDVHGLPEGTA